MQKNIILELKELILQLINNPIVLELIEISRVLLSGILWKNYCNTDKWSKNF